MVIKFASAGTVEQIKKLIADFYYSQPEKITIAENGTVYNNGRELSTFVIKQGKRYIFGK